MSTALDQPFAYIGPNSGPGGMWDGSYGNLINAAKAGGFETLIMMDRYTRKAQVDDIKKAGLQCWVWEEPGHGLTPQRFLDMGYQGCVLQTENPDQRIGALQAFRDGLAYGYEKHIVSYYFGFDDGHGAEYWNEFKVAGCSKFHIEHYAADHTNDTEAYIGTGVHWGIPKEDIIVLFGVYRNEMPDSYTHLEAAGRGYGVYLGDDLRDVNNGDPTLARWKAWGGVNKVALLQYWQVRDKRSGSVLHEERATTWTKQVPVPGTTTTVSQITTGLQECLGWMEKNLQKLRNSGDVELVRVSH